jgi:hypothetical protein
MPNGEFDSAWLKWAMGVMETYTFEETFLSYANDFQPQMALRLSQHYDPKRHCIIVTAEEIKFDMPLIFGGLLGNIVHNFRSCLDQIAWAIYGRGTARNLTAEEESRIYFPIYARRKQFNKSLRKKLPGAKRGDKAIVRRYQPYKYGKRHHRHVFSILDELSRHDKHRTTQPVVGIPQEATWTLLGQTHFDVRRIGPEGPAGELQPGAELARFYGRKTGPNPRIQVHPQFTLDPAIHKTVILRDWMQTTTDVIRALLAEFAPAPPNVRAMLPSRR